MKRLLLMISLLCGSNWLFAQYVYTINADSVKITNHCDTAELIIENHTQDTLGFLFNKGRGRTEFRKALQRLSDSLYLIGVDTLKMRPQTTAANGLSMNGNIVQLGQSTGQAGNPAALLNNREIPLGVNTLSVTGARGSGPFSITFRATSDDFLQSIFNSNSFIRMRVDNTNTGISAGAGTLCTNDASHGGYYYMASTTNAYIPDGFAVVSNGGASGLGLVAGPGPIFFGGYVGPPYSAGEYARFTNAGKLGLGLKTPSAIIHIKAGTATAGTAPLKLTPGTVLTTPEDGTVEYDGTDWYVTQDATRYKLVKALTGQLTTDFGAPSLTAANAVTASVSVPGAQPGDIVTVNANSGVVNPPSIMITAYITTANTVVLQAYNAGNSTVTLASDTYKVRVIK